MSTKPTIYITDTETNTKYKVAGVNKEAKTLDLLNLISGLITVENMSDLTGSRFKIEKIEEPEETQDVYHEPKAVWTSNQTEVGVTADSTPEGIQVPEARTIINLTLPAVTNRKEALALSESYKEELKPILERMKAVKEAVECGLKGEAKKIAYIIQWCEKYLND